MSNRIVYFNREREYKKPTFWRKAILILAVFLVAFFLGGTIYFLRLPEWQVRRISVEGVKSLAEEEIRIRIFEFLEGSYAFLIPKRSIVISSSESLEHFLKKEFLLIASVKVDKKYPDELKIYIKERNLWAIYCISGLFTPPLAGEIQGEGEERIDAECVYLDDTGFAYEKAPSSAGSLILKIQSDEESVALAQQVIAPEKVKKMRAIGEALKQKLDTEAVGYELFSKIPGEIRAVTAEGFKIWLKLDDDIEKTLKILKTALEEEIGGKRGELEYIDARFGNKIFYKLRK